MKRKFIASKLEFTKVLGVWDRHPIQLLHIISVKAYCLDNAIRSFLVGQELPLLTWLANYDLPEHQVTWAKLLSLDYGVKVVCCSSSVSHHSNLDLLSNFFKEVKVNFEVFRVTVLIIGLDPV